MDILVTGCAGYIGSVLVRGLLERGHTVWGIDILLFGDHGIRDILTHSRFNFRDADVRKLNSYQDLLDNVDAVVHLAAIVGDPACAKQPERAEEVNWLATKQLFDATRETSNIKNFIFASTCSNYGKMEGEDFIDERSPLRPVSHYARLKVRAEEHILASIPREGFSPTVLRFATAYGLSPRMRFDLTVNEFTRDVAMGRPLVVYGEHFWRPYCHVDDIAHACALTLEAKSPLIDHEVFNVGDTKENYTKKQLVELLIALEPDAKVSFVAQQDDPRNYKVKFEKIKENLQYRTQYGVPECLKQMYDTLKEGVFADPYDIRYQNH